MSSPTDDRRVAGLPARWRRLADMAEQAAAATFASPAHWAGADARAQALRECADSLEAELSGADHTEDAP